MPPKAPDWLDAFAFDASEPAFVRRTDTGLAGPHVVIVGLMHGNEPAGAEAVARLVRLGPQPVRGRLTLCLANPEAFLRPNDHDQRPLRYRDVDMNRIWQPELWHREQRSAELERAQTIWPWISDADYLLDLHTMGTSSPPLILSGPTARAMELACRLGNIPSVVTDRGHSNGPRLIDSLPFSDPGNAQIAILLEAGRHDDPVSAMISYDVCVRLLEVAGLTGHSEPSSHEPVECLEVTDSVVVEEGPFAFARPFRGLQRIAKRGTIIAVDGGRIIRTPYDDCVLVMPHKPQKLGMTALRLARTIRQPWPSQAIPH